MITKSLIIHYYEKWKKMKMTEVGTVYKVYVQTYRKQRGFHVFSYGREEIVVRSNVSSSI